MDTKSWRKYKNTHFCGLLTFFILLVPHDPFISCLVLLIYVLFSFTFLLPPTSFAAPSARVSLTNNLRSFLSDPLERFLLDLKIVMGNYTLLSLGDTFYCLAEIQSCFWKFLVIKESLVDLVWAGALESLWGLYFFRKALDITLSSPLFSGSHF